MCAWLGEEGCHFEVIQGIDGLDEKAGGLVLGEKNVTREGLEVSNALTLGIWACQGTLRVMVG